MNNNSPFANTGDPDSDIILGIEETYAYIREPIVAHDPIFEVQRGTYDPDDPLMKSISFVSVPKSELYDLTNTLTRTPISGRVERHMEIVDYMNVRGVIDGKRTMFDVISIDGIAAETLKLVIETPLEGKDEKTVVSLYKGPTVVFPAMDDASFDKHHVSVADVFDNREYFESIAALLTEIIILLHSDVTLYENYIGNDLRSYMFRFSVGDIDV